VNIPLPKAQSQYTDTSGVPTYPFYQYLFNLESRVTDLEESGGSVTPPSGQYLPITSNVTGTNSIITYGSLAQGIVLVTLDGDVDVPGPTQYYGSDSTLSKGWYNISDAFLGTSGDITLTVDANGITTIDLADVPNTGVGALFAIARDAKGRIVGYKPATITGTANRISVTDGDAIAGLPTIDIDASYVGQPSITTVGTITTGTWHASIVGVAYGGTGSDLSSTGGTGQYVKQSTVGAALTVGTIPASDIGSGQALTKTDDANVTLTLSGTPATALLKATDLALGWTGQLSIARGGTGQSTSLAAFDVLSPLTTAGDLLVYASGHNARLAVGTNGYVLTVVSGAPSWQPIASSGTVTSVGLSAPAQFSVAGSPVTTSGTLALSWVTQNANLVLAGPSTGSPAAPSFRSLVAADIPSLPFSQITGTVPIAQGGTGQTSANAAYNALSPMTTNGDITIRSGGVATRLAVGSAGQVLGVSSGLPSWVAASTGTVTSVGLTMPSLFSVASSPVTTSGTIAVTLANQNANLVFAGPASGSSSAPGFRSLVAADIAGAIPGDYISGLKIIWNSTTSISVSNGSAVIPSTGILENIPSTLTLSSLSLSASTFYHVYLYDNAGTAAIECVSTAPASPYIGTARSKTGDITRRYIGSVRTTTGGAILNFYHDSNNNEVMYLVDINDASLFVLNGGTAASLTSISLASGVPSTARLATIFGENTANQLLILTNSSVSPSTAVLAFMRPVDQTVNFNIPTDSSQAIQYRYTGSPGSGGAFIWITGYRYER